MAVDKLQAGVHLNPICIGETVGQIYVVERILAAGKFSTVYIARAGQKLVALKVVPIQNGNSNLDIDIAVLKSIGGRDLFPKMFGFGSHRQYRFIAMQLLGPTLNDIMKRPLMQKLCLSSVAKIGIQGLEALSTLHNAGFIHGKVSMVWKLDDWVQQGDFGEDIFDRLFLEPKDQWKLNQFEQQR
ncbi:MAG: hypothetical protein EZS28_014647 [Streblomastix strix]|uniref:Protein kinase domain-containing protein n=1 Tax=Streblomastix strix TaxID=222440 RepID=A0A5J4W552_9EUKA|nr:MAG: hypothetical protein EZS28_014647 [Streblomastix strix]